MKNGIRLRIIKLLFSGALVLLCGWPFYEVKALETAVHGYWESNFILRDTNGFEKSIMDQAEAVQQQNVLKLDVDIYPNFSVGALDILNVHFTYRGKYDSIFSLRKDEYEDIVRDRSGRFNYGRDDIKWENDLREATLSISYEGQLGTFLFRPGRQIVSWGTVTGGVILDRLHPQDNSATQLPYPDEKFIPLWMLRLNYSIPPTPNFGLNFDLVAIPDIRPNQNPPLDESMSAPYVRNTPLAAFKSLFLIPGFKGIYEETPGDRTIYGGQVSCDIGEYVSLGGVFISSLWYNPATVMTELSSTLGGLPNRVEFRHPWVKTYGVMGTYSLRGTKIPVIRYFEALADTLYFEFGISEDTPVSAPGDTVPAKVSGTDVFGAPYLQSEVRLFRKKDLQTYMIGYDKKYWARWLNSKEQISFGVQWIHSDIKDADADMLVNRMKDYSDMISFSFGPGTFRSVLSPGLFVLYEVEGPVAMIALSCSYQINEYWKASVSTQGFWGDQNSLAGFRSFVRQSGDQDAASQIAFSLQYQW